MRCVDQREQDVDIYLDYLIEERHLKNVYFVPFKSTVIANR